MSLKPVPRRHGCGVRPALVVLAIMGACVDAQAQWELKADSVRQPLHDGAWLVQRTVKGRAELSMSLVFFDAGKTQLCIAAQPTLDRLKARTLGEFASAAGAVAACNGGYFTPDFGPSGLELAMGVRTGTWQRGLPFGGVLCVRNGKPALLPDSHFEEAGGLTDLVQCCPLLVSGGAALQGIGGADRVARTFVATDGGEQWVIGFCLRATLPELAEALASPAVMPGFCTQTALNLDGGPSSALWWKPVDATAQALRPDAKVRNVILILPKP